MMNRRFSTAFICYATLGIVHFILAYFVLFRNADNCIGEQPEAEVSVKY